MSAVSTLGGTKMVPTKLMEPLTLNISLIGDLFKIQVRRKLLLNGRSRE